MRKMEVKAVGKPSRFKITTSHAKEEKLMFVWDVVVAGMLKPRNEGRITQTEASPGALIIIISQEAQKQHSRLQSHKWWLWKPVLSTTMLSCLRESLGIGP